MERILDQNLIEVLYERYRATRAGKKVRGIEGKDKAWFLDVEIQAYVLARVTEEGEPTTRIYAVAVAEIDY